MKHACWMALVGVAAAALPAIGQTTPLPLPPTWNSPQNVQFLSATPYGSFSKFGVRVGPYRLQLLGEVGKPTFDAFCVDFANFVASSGWQANIIRLDGDLTGTRQYLLNLSSGDPLGVARRNYEAAAWLAAKMMADPNRSTNWWKYHGAIWYLTEGGDPSDGIPGPSDPFGSRLTSTTRPIVQAYAMNALNAVAGDEVNPGEWAVITPAQVRTSQEFIANVVPEPASLILLGSGLLALGLLAYVRHAA